MTETTFFDCQFSKGLKETRLKICKDNLKMIIEGKWVLSCYMLFPGQKYLPRLAESHPLIRGQPLYCQSSLPSKYFCLNDGYRYLQLLLPRCTHHKYIFACVFQEIKPKGGETGRTKTIQKEEVMLQKKWGANLYGVFQKSLLSPAKMKL
jgi:hypothetical protein